MAVNRRIAVVMLVCIFLLLFQNAVAEEDQKTKGPSPLVQLKEPVYKFEPVLEGKEILHDFIVQNKGTAELDILRVQPG
ncbi:MAG: hypothetical protein ACOZF0_13585 [Thermodesulfobacteriota bacterium]